MDDVARRVLTWFKELGSQGTESVSDNIFTATQRCSTALGISLPIALQTITELKKIGFVDTTRRAGLSTTFVTAITEPGQRALDNE